MWAAQEGNIDLFDDLVSTSAGVVSWFSHFGGPVPDVSTLFERCR